jgi:hypothetical protein
MKIVKSIKKMVVGKGNQIKESASLDQIKKLYELSKIRKETRRS